MNGRKSRVIAGSAKSLVMVTLYRSRREEAKKGKRSYTRKGKEKWKF